MNLDQPPDGATPFDIDLLPTTSPWPSRLMGLSPWQTKARNNEQVLREYDGEKYARIAEWLENAPAAERTPAGAQAVMESSWTTGTRVISFRDRLYEIERSAFDKLRAKVFAELVVPLAAEGADSIAELGCAFGFQLSLIRASCPLPLVGGELSPKAVRVAGALLRPHDRTEVLEFDFLDATSYARIFAAAGKSVTIFTSHAVSMLPSAHAFVENLRPYRDRIRRVVHLEPITGQFDRPTLLDQLRVSYAHANDYNRDLLDLVRTPEFVIERQEKDILGQNPLTPLNLLVWSFA